jgi:ATP-binding cassette subfamily B multidrug efflux pump
VTWTALRRLLPYVRRYQRAVVLGLLASLVATGIQLVGPWVLRLAIDDLADGASLSTLSGYAAALLAIAVVGGWFRFQMRQKFVIASRDIEFDIRNDFLRQLQRLPLAYFQARRTGDLMSRATNDLSAVRMMAGPAVMYAVSTGIVFVVAILLMLSIDPWLTGMALIPLPFVSIAVYGFGTSIHRRFEQIQAQLSELSAVTQESLAGVRVVRAYRQEETELARFQRANEEFLRRNRRLIGLQGVFYPTLTFLLGVGALVVLWLGGRAVIGGRLTVGEFVAFNAYLAMLGWPMIAFGWVTNLLQRGSASWGRMLEVLDAPPAIVDGSRTDVPARLSGTIEWRHVTFAYPVSPKPDSAQTGTAKAGPVSPKPGAAEAGGDGPTVLHDISLRVPAGTTLAIVGPTGSGKSTLVSLLPRLYDPPPGTVFVDGIDVRDLPLSVLRGSIGMVPQEPFLFSDTIAGNVAFGTPERDEIEDLKHAVAVARLDVDVETFPDRWTTAVGERGLTLSGGQKQRTAIARALMVDPPILILDDALSAVDTDTEAAILNGLVGVLRSRTAILISHRASTIRHADHIVVLDGGRIVEQGTHDALLQAGGPYAEMCRLQRLEEELAAS